LYNLTKQKFTGTGSHKRERVACAAAKEKTCTGSHHYKRCNNQCVRHFCFKHVLVFSFKNPNPLSCKRKKPKLMAQHPQMVFLSKMWMRSLLLRSLI
jgi:hypothetical protein